MKIIQSAKDKDQIKEPCSKCGGKAMHLVNGYQLCCECYIKDGNAPADWHPECNKWHLKLHPPKKWKFRIGDSVMVLARPHNFIEEDTEAYIIECSCSGYEGYMVTFKNTGGRLAWVRPEDLTLIEMRCPQNV